MYSEKVSHCLYGAGISMFLTGILLFIFVVFMDNDKKQHWYYIVTPWQGFWRRVKNTFISLFWLGGIATGGIGYFLSTYGPYPKQSHLMFAGMMISSLAMLIKSLRTLFEKYMSWREYDAQHMYDNERTV